MMVRLALHLLSFLWMYPMARAPYEKRMRLIRRLGTPFSAWLAIGLGTTSIDAQTPSDHSLGHSLTFAASFDHGVDADYSSGDAALWWAPSMNKRKEAQKGLPPSGEVEWQKQGGKFGGSLRFDQSKGPMVFFRGDKNYPAPKSGWSATVSFWLSTEPQTELPDGFCDPLQITSKQWDDASIFVEFEKRPNAIPFRLGVYADKSVWNPQNKKFADIPPAERPLVTVETPPFSKEKWTHVVLVHSRFNTGRADGEVTLYLDGEKKGDLKSRNQTFTWSLPRPLS